MKVIGAYYKSSEIDVFVYEEGSMNRLYGPRIIQPPIIEKLPAYSPEYSQHELLFHSL